MLTITEISFDDKIFNIALEVSLDITYTNLIDKVHEACAQPKLQNLERQWGTVVFSYSYDIYEKNSGKRIYNGSLQSAGFTDGAEIVFNAQTATD